MAQTNDSGQSMGEILKSARLRMNCTIDMVHKSTKIPVKFLEAVEGNRRDADFPAPIYVKGFVRSYCEFLNLNFEELWEKFHPKPPEPVAAPAETHAAAHPQPAFNSAFDVFVSSFAGPASGMAGISALILIMGLMWLWRAVPSQHAENSHVPAVTGLEAVTQTPPLKAFFKQKAWLRVKADGITVFEGFAPAGTTLEWKTRNAFDLRVPRPEDVLLTLGDKRVSSEKIQPGSFQLP